MSSRNNKTFWKITAIDTSNDWRTSNDEIEFITEAIGYTDDKVKEILQSQYKTLKILKIEKLNSNPFRKLYD